MLFYTFCLISVKFSFILNNVSVLIIYLAQLKQHQVDQCAL